ncbi:MAG: hypothetical protein LUQ65_06050 [Candidatus Helarchaeota archaeon]|nr:hypothetical protein [Candidatus Helarchaeota archaeon]
MGVQPHVIKINVESAEIEVLQRLTCVLQGSATVFCELHPFLCPEHDIQSLILKSLLDQTERSMETLREESMLVYQHEPVVLEKKKKVSHCDTTN